MEGSSFRWTQVEAKQLISIWEEEEHNLRLSTEKDYNHPTLYKLISNRIKESGSGRTHAQVVSKVKRMRDSYLKEKARRRKTGEGRERLDDSEADDDTYYGRLNSFLGEHPSVDPKHVVDTAKLDVQAEAANSTEDAAIPEQEQDTPPDAEDALKDDEENVRDKTDDDKKQKTGVNGTRKQSVQSVKRAKTHKFEDCIDKMMSSFAEQDKEAEQREEKRRNNELECMERQKNEDRKAQMEMMKIFTGGITSMMQIPQPGHMQNQAYIYPPQHNQHATMMYPTQQHGPANTPLFPYQNVQTNAVYNTPQSQQPAGALYTSQQDPQLNQQPQDDGLEYYTDL